MDISEENQIKTYLSKTHSLEVFAIKKHIPEKIIIECNKCGCPRDYNFKIDINAKNAKTLYEEDWVFIDSSQ